MSFHFLRNSSFDRQSVSHSREGGRDEMRMGPSGRLLGVLIEATLGGSTIIVKCPRWTFIRQVLRGTFNRPLPVVVAS